MDQDQSTNQEETTDKVEDKGKIDKLEKELDVIGEKAQKEIADKPPVQPQAVPVQPQQDQTQNAPAPQPTQQPTTPPPGAKPGGMNKVLKIAIILLLFSVFVAVIYFGKDYFLQLKTESTPTPMPTPTETPDPTADWEMYTNAVNKFSFKYSSDWEVTSQDSTISAGLTEIIKLTKTLPDQTPQTGDVTTGWASISINLYDTQTAEEIISSLSATALQTEQVVLSNKNATRTISQTGIASSVYAVEIITTLQNKAFHIIFTTQDQVNKDTFETEFDQILSTFEFTEATSSATPTSTPSGTLD